MVIPISLAQVLRRAQLALKSADDGDDGKGEGDAGPSKPGPKTKGKGKGKGKGRGKGKVTGKAEGKAKARSRKSKKNDESEDAEMKASVANTEVPDDSAPSDPPGLENPDKSKGPENLDMVGESEKVVEPEKEDKPPAKPNSKKRQAAGGHKVAGGSGGSQPDEVKPKKRKANPENAEPAPKKAAAKKKTCETSDADQTAKKAKTQPATFARRAQPTTSFGKARWLALRDVFNNRIRAFVKAPSKHEDCFLTICACFPLLSHVLCFLHYGG